MYIAHRWGDRNLTRLEYVFAILILAIMIGVFSRYALVMFARAEQSIINSTVININTALHYRAALALMRGKYQDLKLLEETNPMQELQSNISIDEPEVVINNISFTLLASSSYISTNYAGEINAYTMDSMEKGKWYFNQDNRSLIYVIRNSEFFSSDAEGLPLMQFEIVIDYNDKNTNGEYDPESDEFRTIKLQPINNYEWNY